MAGPRWGRAAPASDGAPAPGAQAIRDAGPPVPRGLAAMPYAVMAVVLIVDVAAGPGVGLLPLMALGPAFAGLAGSRRRTALIGAMAVVLSCGLGLYDGLAGSRRGITAVASVLGVTAAALIAAGTRRRRERELARVRSIAEVAQRVLLRPVPRAAGPLRVAVSYTSAVAEARIGGDLYEVVASPVGVRVIIGDVQGKGLGAVETAAAVLGAFREAAYDEPDLAALGERVQKAAERAVEGEKFITAVIAEIQSGTGASLINFGHPPPMVVTAGGEVHFPEPPRYALPLGLGLAPDDTPAPFRVPLEPGDQMLLYTDGVSEARDRAGDFYPLRERAHLLHADDPDTAIQDLKADVAEHTAGSPQDDAAMLLLRYRTPAPRGIPLPRDTTEADIARPGDRGEQ